MEHWFIKGGSQGCPFFKILQNHLFSGSFRNSLKKLFTNYPEIIGLKIES